MPNDIQDWGQQIGDFRQLLAADLSTQPAAPAPLFTVAGSGSASGRVLLKSGVVAIRVLATCAGLAMNYRLLALGHQSVIQYFGDPSAPGSSLRITNPTLPVTIPINRDLDSQLDLQVFNDGANSMSVWVSELTLADYVTGAIPQPVTLGTPWPTLWAFSFDSQEPAAGVQAVAQLIGFTGLRYVCRAIMAEMGCLVAPGANATRLRLRDGAPGVGAIIWSRIVSIQNLAGASSNQIQLADLSIKGTSGNSMTLEFATPLPNVFESCSLGVDLIPG